MNSKFSFLIPVVIGVVGYFFMTSHLQPPIKTLHDELKQEVAFYKGKLPMKKAPNLDLTELHLAEVRDDLTMTFTFHDIDRVLAVNLLNNTDAQGMMTSQLCLDPSRWLVRGATLIYVYKLSEEVLKIDMYSANSCM